MAANRIYWAITALSTAPESTGSAGPVGEKAITAANFVPGVQSVGITTTFNLEQVFELGQLELYQDVEEVPDIEVSVERVIDEHILLYTRCVDPATPAGNKTISAIQNNKVDVFMNVHPDSADNAGDTAPDAIVHCSGMYLSSVSFNMATDGNLTESITLVGNHKRWRQGKLHDVGTNTHWAAGTPFVAADVPRGMPTATNIDAKATGAVVKRRQNVHITPPASAGGSDAKVTSASVSCDFGREQINVLGARLPYHRYVSYPVEVTCDLEVVITDINDQGITALPESDNLSEETLKFIIKDDAGVSIATIDLGSKNKLTSVTWGGGDTGGGNATFSYSYRNFNKMDVQSHKTTYSIVECGDDANKNVTDYTTSISC